MSSVETNLECLFIILENYKLNIQDIGFSRLQRIQLVSFGGESVINEIKKSVIKFMSLY